MGIANTFTFGGVSTAAYGLVVEGPGDYSAPKRAVNTFAVPGRNGAVIVDQGYYENITVEYTVVVAENTQSDFTDSIEAFRNAIVSLTGYQRLEDTYHPGEYRMARYEGGLDEDPAFHGKGALFKIKFDCKPQRFLTSGETAITVSDGDTVTNPTLFESNPIIKVSGYGIIGFNGYEIQVEQKPIGNVVLSDAKSFSVDIPYGSPLQPAIDLNDAINIDTSVLNNGDAITLVGVRAEWTLNPKPKYTFDYITLDSETGAPANTTVYAKDNIARVTTNLSPLSFTFGTPSTATHGTEFSYRYTDSQGSGSQSSPVRDISIAYDGAQTFTIYVEGDDPAGDRTQTIAFSLSEIDAVSSVIVTDPVFIDCEIGEAYWIINNEAVDGNSFVAIGSELPTLASGVNSIEYDNTFSSVKITPRWWKV